MIRWIHARARALGAPAALAALAALVVLSSAHPRHLALGTPHEVLTAAGSGQANLVARPDDCPLCRVAAQARTLAAPALPATAPRAPLVLLDAAPARRAPATPRLAGVHARAPPLPA